METGIQQHTEQFVHDISNPGAPGLCPEMLEVAEEACRAGDFDLAAEIYGSQLADLQQPDRGLCLRRADSLVRAGRIAEALDSYCTAANLKKLRPEELGLLVENIARTLREKELPAWGKESSHQSELSKNPQKPETKASSKSSGNGGTECGGEAPEDEQPLDLFSCHICKLLLSEPTTLLCGHTFCKRCLEDDGVSECKSCRYKLNKTDSQIQPVGFRVNVILSSLLEKWFDSESKARRYWLEGEAMWREKSLKDALDKYNKAVELTPTDVILLGQRAELHMEMQNFTQALKDGDAMCRLHPHLAKPVPGGAVAAFSPPARPPRLPVAAVLRPVSRKAHTSPCLQAHSTKAAALSQAGRHEEALQEYLLCMALKPHCTSVKMEAQKILSEMFSSVFENDGLPTPLRPHQPARVKPPPLLFLGSAQRLLCSESQEAGSSKDPPFPRGDGPIKLPLQPSPGKHETLTSVLSDLKRKGPSDTSGFAPPCKVLRQAPCSSQNAPVPSRCRAVPPQLLESADMECSLCMRLFYEPVATPCGHTFCLKCLERCLDHNPNCPLCKENLSEYLATRGYKKTLLMEEVLRRYLSEELAERKKIHEEELKELSNLNQEVPIFVCTMAFPTIPCPLHVFEPRYRLMIRRSMETGTRQFGMCIADELKGFADYGCMLEVRNVKFFPDGRSVVDTIGVARFKVLSHGQRDGYNTAKIEYLEDRKVYGEELAELLRLHDSVYETATSWFTSLKDTMRNQILSHFGNLPARDPDPQGCPNGPAWCWWLLAVLPLENRAQLSILAMTSMKDRLLAIRRVLIYVTRKRAR
ncbi:LON peptidase N-terminal domain and RING finger protein 2 isoform X2 [Brienomyrus brachyistius]|uniref:LON peptidase N-terminal domain and RING finger protein 2 isoform X2 n=1 Tax=Brienomyrus brachyistius TaxID=42636 RepID=UPI0020B2FCF4|nr:LON peptidase N-terminal domain and RING finger protein 2 isoform X2 [Brienomyrus brachyistius]